MKHAASRELYQYWNRVRGVEPAPQRSVIEPSDLRRILPDTFILEVSEPARYLVRLAGTRVCAIFGRELKGTDLLDLWQGEDRSAMATLAAAVSQDGAAAVVTVEGLTMREASVACELLLLPLRHGGPAFDRVLGSFAALGRPSWLGSEPVIRQTITSLRLIWPKERPGFFRRKTDFQPDAAPVPLPARSSRRRGHLFVVDGGKQ